MLHIIANDRRCRHYRIMSVEHPHQIMNVMVLTKAVKHDDVAKEGGRPGDADNACPTSQACSELA